MTPFQRPEFAGMRVAPLLHEARVSSPPAGAALESPNAGTHGGQMFDLGSIGTALFGSSFGSFIESLGGGEQAEQTHQTGHGLAAADQMTTANAGTSSSGFWSDPFDTIVEFFFGKSKELGVPNEVRQQGYAHSSSWDQSYAAAVAALSSNFDLLDTASGFGGRDGMISRTDLEAALRNPSLPQGLRDACRFLLQNPAAWNRLDAGGGIGNVDGLIARSDLEAAAAQAEMHGMAAVDQDSACGSATGPGYPRPGDGCGYDGSDHPDHGESSCGCQHAEGTWGSCGTYGDAQEGVSDTLWSKVEKYEDEMQALLADLETAESSSEVAKIQLALQQTAEKRKLMFELISTMSRLDHEMAKTALENMGRA